MNFANNYEIILCCGRHFTDYDYFRSSCASVISQLDTDKEIEIVSGHCKGCDRFCEKFAQEQGYKLLVFEANWKTLIFVEIWKIRKKRMKIFVKLFLKMMT
ncbi:MAG: DUF2493 domain-containing protein [Clostridia bacterium]|nr:DUF2493 domain-containing protein [Clostridia bacterium]